MGNKRPADERGRVDTDVDRFPTLAEMLSRVGGQSSIASERVRRIDIRADAGGFVYYRVWIGREDEHQSGAVPISK